MAHGASGTLHGVAEHHDEHAHPGERTYIRVAVVLAIITIVEVAIYYLDLPDWFLISALLILSAVKFTIVVGFFMHLKFDDKRLLAIFAGGLFLGGAILLALDVLMAVDSLDYANDMIVEGAAPAEEH